MVSEIVRTAEEVGALLEAAENWPGPRNTVVDAEVGTVEVFCHWLFDRDEPSPLPLEA